MQKRKLICGYTRFIAKYPFINIIVITIIIISCSIRVCLRYDFPDFDDPTIGFETRGTIIKSRMIATNHLINRTKSKKILYRKPLINEKIKKTPDDNYDKNNFEKAINLINSSIKFKKIEDSTCLLYLNKYDCNIHIIINKISLIFM